MFSVLTHECIYLQCDILTVSTYLNVTQKLKAYSQVGLWVISVTEVKQGVTRDYFGGYSAMCAHLN